MGTPRQESPLRIESLEEGAYWKVVMGGSKGNIIDIKMIQALSDAFGEAAKWPELRVLCLEGEGKHFSFGASVPEHLPERAGELLPAFHELFRNMLDTNLVILAAVRGQCLGGGLEIAGFCHRVFASKDAKLGQPEIRLGVLAPVASVVLPERIGRAHAEDLCLSGRILAAEEALRIGLVDEVTDDPGEAALSYAREHLLSLSASSLRVAVKAVRHSLRTRLSSDLAVVERIYLNELMETEDAAEGIRAFLEKREPQWKNR